MTTIFIPGWATTNDLFKIQTPFPKLTPRTQSDLETYLQNHSKKINLIGFSLGGMIAATAAAKHPEKIHAAILISLRPEYKKEEIIPLKSNLEKNKALTLKQFYKAAIHTQKEWQDFETHHLNDQTNAYDTPTLLTLLDQLSKLKITSQQLKKIPNLKIIHGSYDKIAPIEEVKKIHSNLNILETGHIPNLDLCNNLVHTA